MNISVRAPCAPCTGVRVPLVLALALVIGPVVGAGRPASAQTQQRVTVLATADAPSGQQCVKGTLTSGTTTPTSATKTVKSQVKAEAVLAGSTITCQVQVGAHYTVPSGGPNPVPLRIVMNGTSWQGVLASSGLGGSVRARGSLVVRSAPSITAPVLGEAVIFDVTSGQPNNTAQSYTVNLARNVGEELYIYLYLWVQANAGRVGVAEVDFGSTSARGMTYNDIVVVANGVPPIGTDTTLPPTGPPAPITLTQANIPPNTSCTARNALQTGNATASLPAREVRVTTRTYPTGRITCKADVGTSFVVPGAAGTGTLRTRITMTADWSGKVEGVSGIVRVKLYVKKPNNTVLGMTEYVGVGVTSTAQGPVVSTQQGVTRSVTLTLNRGTTVNVSLYIEAIATSSVLPGHLPGTSLDFLSGGYGARWSQVLVEFLS